MSRQPDRRHKTREVPRTPTGYRSTKRAGKVLKGVKRAQQRHRVLDSLDRFRRRVRNVVLVAVQALAVAAFSVIVLLIVATAINYGVRWNATRLASETDPAVAARQQLSKENLIVVAIKDDEATGFLAMRIDPGSEHVYGIAIPDGAFVDVPGSGFSRIGESWTGDGDQSATAISNYLGVPFDAWVAVPASNYRDALTSMDVSRLVEGSLDSNLDESSLADVGRLLVAVDREDVALAPMPVKPIKLGDQTYFEPQRDQLADLLSSWWGIDADEAAELVRIIVYNGAGVPGVAGEAAQHLIRAGFRVVDTKNADTFDYDKTIVVVKRGDEETGRRVADSLDAEIVRLEPSDQSVADVIVIIGKDYTPPKSGE